MIDAIGPDAKLIWAQDAQGEIGKRPPLESHLFEVSAESLEAQRLHAKYMGGKRRG